MFACNVHADPIPKMSTACRQCQCLMTEVMDIRSIRQNSEMQTNKTATGVGQVVTNTSRHQTLALDLSISTMHPSNYTSIAHQMVINCTELGCCCSQRKDYDVYIQAPRARVPPRLPLSSSLALVASVPQTEKREAADTHSSTCT